MGLCYSCVDQSTVGIVTQFGKFQRIAYPGFNCIHCYIGEGIAGTLSLRIQQLDVRCETKTKDNVFVTMVVTVQYQVVKESLIDAFYKLTDSRSQITSYVFDVVRSTVPKINLDDVFTEKEEIAAAIKSELTANMASFGFSIIQTLITDIDPAAKVKSAMNDINAAQRLRIAAVERAEAEKIQVVKAAEADAEAKFLSGQGIARQRQAIVNGLRESIVLFSDQVGFCTDPPLTTPTVCPSTCLVLLAGVIGALHPGATWITKPPSALLRTMERADGQETGGGHACRRHAENMSTNTGAVSWLS